MPEGDGQARVGDDAPVGDLALLVDHALAVDDALALVVGDLLEKGRSWASSRPSLLLFIAERRRPLVGGGPRWAGRQVGPGRLAGASW